MNPRIHNCANLTGEGNLSPLRAGGGEMTRRAVLLAAAALVAMSAQAFNWSDYAEGADVLVPASATATDVDMAAINAYSKLRFESGTTITFDISGDVSLACPVAATGTIVKCGSGSLALATSSVHGSINTYRHVDFEVEDGMLKLPQDNFTLADIWVRKVTVGENGAFMTVIDHNTNIEGGLWGSGPHAFSRRTPRPPTTLRRTSTTPICSARRPARAQWHTWDLRAEPAARVRSRLSGADA